MILEYSRKSNSECSIKFVLGNSVKYHCHDLRGPVPLAPSSFTIRMEPLTLASLVLPFYLLPP